MGYEKSAGGCAVCADCVFLPNRIHHQSVHVRTSGNWGTMRFQSSPARGGGCNDLVAPFGVGEAGVSILTRPWGRVQRVACGGCVCGVDVSILTRPWGRVQLWLRNRLMSASVSFQSSPARGGGCNKPESHGGNGHDHVSILTRPWGRVQRCPAIIIGLPRSSLFQSSPARGGGCNGAWGTHRSGSPSEKAPVVKVRRAALWAANSWARAYGHKVCSVTPCGGVSTCTA